MAKPKKPQDALVVNGWYIELPGITPLFRSLDGIQKMTENVEIVDAGSNRKFKFGSQIIDFGNFTLVRQFDGSQDDSIVQGIADECVETGLKFPARLVKLHWGKEIFSLGFEGFRFSGYTYPALNTAGQETFDVTFQATVDNVFKI